MIRGIAFTLVAGLSLGGYLLRPASAAQNKTLSDVRVVLAGTDTGVPSEIFAIPDGSKVPVRTDIFIDKSGKATSGTPWEWKPGHSLFAQPQAVAIYFNSIEVRQPSEKLRFEVKARARSSNNHLAERKKTFQLLIKNGETAAQTGDFGASALISAELAWQVDDASAARDARTMSILHAARVLEVDQPLSFDTQQRQLVMSREMVVAIGKYQQEKKIKVTRDLDNATLTSMAGKPNYVFQFYGPEQVAQWTSPQAKVLPREEVWATLEKLSVSSPEIQFLTRNLRMAEAERNWGVVSLISNELAQRVKTVPGGPPPPAVVNALEVWSYEGAGKVLQVQQATRFDPVQARYVPSAMLEKKVADHYIEAGKQAPKTFNYSTYSWLADADIAPYLVK
jgi:hypothetical protein